MTNNFDINIGCLYPGNHQDSNYQLKVDLVNSSSRQMGIIIELLKSYVGARSSSDPFNWEWLDVVTTIKLMKYFWPEAKPIKVVGLICIFTMYLC